MSVELKVPSVGESITEVQISQWLKAEGDVVAKDENLVEIETDKATVELPAPIAGRVVKVLKRDGETATVGEIIGYMEEAAVGSAPRLLPSQLPPKLKRLPRRRQHLRRQSNRSPRRRPRRSCRPLRRELAQHNLKPADVKPTGPGGRMLKEDVQRQVAQAAAPAPATAAPIQASPVVAATPAAPVARPPARREAPKTISVGGREEESVPMSPLRRRIAERLVEAQQVAALLTTFNEVDLQRGHGPACRTPRSVSADLRREAGLHVVLHQSHDRGAQGDSADQRRDSRQPNCLSQLL